MAPPFEDMTNTFVFSAAPSTNRAVLAEVPKGLHNPSRQRQSHRKSRAGCDNCKRRRVKCNEEVPCAGCRRRREVCERPGHRLQPAVPKPMDTVAPPTATSLTAPTRNTGDSVVNLLHLKLLHHFQVHTCQTLVFSADVWATALQLSFQFEFLSNAVLCVAARHLAFLHMDSADASSVSRGAGPDAASYAATAATHLCRALAGFRRELMTKDFSTATDLDAFIITSTLLQFELWSSTDFLPSGRRGLDLERDRLFTFSASLKLVFLKSVPEALRQQPDSVFMPYIQHNPALSLLAHARISRVTAEAFHSFFFPLHGQGEDTVSSDDGGSGSCMRQRLSEKLPPFVRRNEFSSQVPWSPDFVCASTPAKVHSHTIDVLCLLASFLPEAQPVHTSTERVPLPLLADMERAVFSFPVLCRISFVDLLHRHDLDAFFLLYHFYRTIRQLLPQESCWWAHGRTAVMEGALYDWLQTA